LIATKPGRINDLKLGQKFPSLFREQIEIGIVGSLGKHQFLLLQVLQDSCRELDRNPKIFANTFDAYLTSRSDNGQNVKLGWLQVFPIHQTLLLCGTLIGRDQSYQQGK
jgi:hypothetical protein